jgi:hypothetical protein
MQGFSGIMKNEARGACNTFSPLTDSNIRGIEMAETSLTNDDKSAQRTYERAKARCTNPHNNRFHRYGGRGIEFRFASITEFIATVGPRPSPNHSIDRIDNDGHYEPGNVRWATRTEQANNRKTNRLITLDGITKTVAEWGPIYGISPKTISTRINAYGWDEERAVRTPVIRQGDKEAGGWLTRRRAR